MQWLEEKYIMLLSGMLPKFKKRQSHTYNFRCPYCGDSAKSKSKARGYLYDNKKGGFSFHCYNCGIGRMFSRFLREQNSSLYSEYLMESMKESGVKTTMPGEDDIIVQREDAPNKSIFKGLSRISDLNMDHFAKRFVMSRKIPGKFHGTLYFTPRYKSFVNSLIPNKLGGKDGPRLIIPFLSYGGLVVGFTARALDDDPLRYSMIILNESLPRVYGLDRVDMNKKYYVVEGPIDSMFIDNTIAIGSSDLVGGLRKIDANRENAVIIFDNEPRNAEIVKKINQAIVNNYNVVIWPSDITQKDINEMVLGGYSPSTINMIIDKNTFHGIKATLALTNWKKIDDTPKSKSNFHFKAS